MLDFIFAHADTLITVSVTIIGFIVTYFMTQKNLRDEIIQSKVMANADNIRSLPYDICHMMDSLSGKNGSKPMTAAEYTELLTKVLAYGSKDAVKIAVRMQEIVYSNNQGGSHSSEELLACYSLLITQIKYDLTAEIISPECWFKLKITDYAKLQKKITIYNNSLVKELDLRRDFLIDETDYGV